jgi:hypothetical protein
MGWLTRLEALAERAADWPEHVSRITDERGEDSSPRRPRWGRRTFAANRDPRPLDDDDIDSFLLASGEAREQHRKEMERAHPPRTFGFERVAFLKWVRQRHPGRLERLGRELDWLRREARKYGINPEEIRWLL